MKKIIKVFALCAVFAALFASCKMDSSGIKDIKPTDIFEEAPASNVISAQWNGDQVTFRSLGGKKGDIKAGVYTVEFVGEKDPDGSEPALTYVSPWWSIQGHVLNGGNGSESPLEFTLTDADVATFTGEGCECGKHIDVDDPKDASGGDIRFVMTKGAKITINKISYKPLPAPAE